MPLQHWPERLWIVRHGESAGNVARDAAHASNLTHIETGAARDVDVPLSPLGHRQSAALGHWFAAMPEHERPEIVLASPYRRAWQTAAIVEAEGGLAPDACPIVADERLREKEFGVLDRLTQHGIGELHPEQAEFRRLLGKFYHRPPGGESWCDVILRLRSALDTLSLHHANQRVLIVAHQVVVLCFRYLLERMTEEQILAVDRARDIANCSVTSYEFDPTLGKRGKLVPRLFNFVAPLEEAGEKITRNPDVPVAPK
jgi:broad specificity phosphatase PhoE